MFFCRKKKLNVIRQLRITSKMFPNSLQSTLSIKDLLCLVNGEQQFLEKNKMMISCHNAMDTED